jgi:UrcA family protein
MNTITSRPLRTLVAGAILGALAFSFGSVSSAAESTKPPQVIVKFADLDVSSSHGAATLYGRIHSAAVNVCWRMVDSNDNYALSKDACIQKTIADAVMRIDQPALSAVFASKYGVSAPAVLASVETR